LIYSRLWVNMILTSKRSAHWKWKAEFVFVSPKEAHGLAVDTLSRCFPDTDFIVAPVKFDAPPKDTIVFRAKQKGQNISYICKVADDTEAARAKLTQHVKAQQSAAEYMTGSTFRVPTILAFEPDLRCFVQEDVKGEMLGHVIRDKDTFEPRLKAVLRAVGWISAFHSGTAQSGTFDPDPYMDWLGGIDFETCFDAELTQGMLSRLSTLAAESRGKTARYCVTHRDLHASQFMLRGNGTVYALDFEYLETELAVRDLHHFWAHIARKKRLRSEISSDDLWDVILSAYGPLETDPNVLKFSKGLTLLARYQRYCLVTGADSSQNELALYETSLETFLND